jgi:predicted O-methyltransferase YrrM
MAYCLLNLLLFLGISLNAWTDSTIPCTTCSSSILEGKIPVTDQRYSTFCFLFELLKDRNAQVIVETGTAREGSAWCVGDGCSTLLFAEWVKRHGGIFYSVDIDKKALKKAKRAIGSTPSTVHLIHNDSVEFLANFDRKIDCLYLDSFDFDIDNPQPSQEHHLKEIQAAYPHLTRNSVVMIDDCALPHGGKGLLVIQFLVEKGWKIVANGYQVILISGI